MVGKEHVELVVAVDRDGGIGAGDADGDGEIDEGADGTVISVPRRQVLVPLLSRGQKPRHVLKMGSEVFAMVGGWREALVEPQPDVGQHPSRYLLNHGRGELRWADGGEMAWHDIPPMAYDVGSNQPMLAWAARGATGAFQSAHIEAPDGAGYKARFDDGVEQKLEIATLRERWTLPLRVLCRYGDYRPAKVLEAMAGLLRVQFEAGAAGGGGIPAPEIRWALPEELLAEPADATRPFLMDMRAGSHVAVAADDGSWQRALLLEDITDDSSSEVEIVRDERGQKERIPLTRLRRPRDSSEQSELREGSQVESTAAHGRTAPCARACGCTCPQLRACGCAGRATCPRGRRTGTWPWSPCTRAMHVRAMHVRAMHVRAMHVRACACVHRCWPCTARGSPGSSAASPTMWAVRMGASQPKSSQMTAGPFGPLSPVVS